MNDAMGSFGHLMQQFAEIDTAELTVGQRLACPSAWEGQCGYLANRLKPVVHAKLVNKENRSWLGWVDQQGYVTVLERNEMIVVSLRGAVNKRNYVHA